jgi:cell division inhibitor SepF
MGIYLGLVEDDDTGGYGRYEGRQGDYPDHPDRHLDDRRPDDRRPDDRHADDRRSDDRRLGRYHGDGAYDEAFEEYEKPGYHPAPYGSPAYEDEPERPAAPSTRDPEPATPRRAAAARPIGLAPGAAPAGRTPVAGGASGGPGGAARTAAAAGLAVREPVPAEPVVAPAAKSYRITTVHPKTYNEARTIGERYRDGCPVIMNLTELDDADAKRLVDFAAGLIFGLRGSIERVTAKVFLLSPQDVDVTAEDKARIREGGFFNQS